MADTCELCAGGLHWDCGPPGERCVQPGSSCTDMYYQLDAFTKDGSVKMAVEGAEPADGAWTKTGCGKVRIETMSLNNECVARVHAPRPSTNSDDLHIYIKGSGDCSVCDTIVLWVPGTQPRPNTAGLKRYDGVKIAVAIDGEGNGYFPDLTPC